MQLMSCIEQANIHGPLKSEDPSTASLSIVQCLNLILLLSFKILFLFETPLS